MSNGGQKKRRTLWSKDSYCHWCGILTRFRVVRARQALKPDEATIDHVYHSGHHLRKRFPNLRVLACYRCNQERNKIWDYVFKPSLMQPSNFYEIETVIATYYRDTHRAKSRMKDLEKKIKNAPDWKTTKSYMQELDALVNQKK